MIDPKILADRTKYPDTLKIDLGDGASATLGDVREFYAQQAEEVNKVTGRNTFVEGEYAKMVEQYNQMAQQLETMRQQIEQGKQGPQGDIVEQLVERLTKGNQPNVFDRPGDYFKPVVDRLTKFESDMAALAKRQEEFQKTLRSELTGAFGFQAQKDLKRDFRAYTWPKDVTFDKVMAYAKQNNLLEAGSGYPDFDTIHERITGPERTAKERAELEKTAEERGYARAQDEFRKNGGTFVPGPGFGGGGVPAPKGKFGGVDKIPDETILNDPDVWNVAVQ